MSQFYLNISPWMLKSINRRHCFKCSQPMLKENLIGLGVREIKDGVVLFLEHDCNHCHYKEIVPVNNKKEFSIEELCYSLIDEIQNRRAIRVAQHIEKPMDKAAPISKKEADAFIRFLKKNVDHEQFMRHIGQPPPENEE